MAKINFNIPVARKTKIVIYNILGKEAAILINKILNPGNHEFDLNELDLPEGEYFCKLESESYVETKKMFLFR